MSPLVISSPYWGPPRRQGYVAIVPNSSPRRQGLCSHFRFHPLIVDPREGTGYVAKSHFIPLFGTPEKAGLCSHFRFHPLIGDPQEGKGYATLF